MGSFLCLCCLQKNEEDIPLQSFDSITNRLLSSIEYHYNSILNRVPFLEFSYFLWTFNKENAVSAPIFDNKYNSYSYYSPIFSENFEIELFLTFLETKLFKTEYLYKYLGEKETLCTELKDVLLKYYESLRQIFSKHPIDEKYQRTLKTFSKGDYLPGAVKKYHILAMGLLFCGGKRTEKVHFLYTLFSKDKSFRKSKELDDFLTSLFLIPSYCQLFVKIKLGNCYKNIGEISKIESQALMEMFTMRDILALIETFNKYFFTKDEGSKSDGGNVNCLELEDFLKKFTKKQFSWILSPSGIRSMLEKKLDKEEYQIFSEDSEF